MQAQTELEQTRTEVEKIMMGINPSRTDIEKRMYVGGHIDCLLNKGHITPETRDSLYAEYCF